MTGMLCCGTTIITNGMVWFWKYLLISWDCPGIVDVLNVKSDPLLIGSLRGQDGYFPAYHMNKEKWLSIQLGKPELDDAIKDLLSLSYELTAPKKRNSKLSAKNPGDSANGKEKETDEG